MPIFRGFPHFVSMRSPGFAGHEIGGVWWLVMMPGLGLIGAALAMIIWPDLLAYVVASLLLCAGIALTGMGWRMWKIEQRLRRDGLSPHSRHTYDADDWTG